MDLWYFAHPYTVKDNSGNHILAAEQANFQLCCYRSAELLHRGVMVYSPIAHTHPIHVAWPQFLQNGEWKLWMTLGNLIMDRCEFTGIILAPKWDMSKGCKAERERFDNEKKWIVSYDEALEWGKEQK